MSISETATNFNQTNFILPFSLGALAIFALSYSIVSAYDTTDRILSMTIAIGFFVTAAQPCLSEYTLTLYETLGVDRVGLFMLHPETSGTVHNTAAIISFGAMILWIMFKFRASDKPKNKQTPQKKIRNSIYFWIAVAMIACLGLFVFELFGILRENFPTVYWAEAGMLTFAAPAVWIKGGLFLRDKKRTV